MYVEAEVEAEVEEESPASRGLIARSRAYAYAEPIIRAGPFQPGFICSRESADLSPFFR